jgi:hypothetical protein
LDKRNLTEYKWLFIVLIGVLILDLLVRFNVGFYENGYYVNDRKRIRDNYVGVPFIFDLIALFAVTYDVIMWRKFSMSENFIRALFIV